MMRIILDVSDSDDPFVKATSEHNGQVIVVGFNSTAVPARVIGRVVPKSVMGSGHKYTAFYDITLLDEL